MEGRKLVKKTAEKEPETKVEEKEVIVKEEAGVPSTINYSEDLAGGFENVTSKDFKIPIVRVLASGSPEIDEDDAKYVEGAKLGSLYNISTKEAFDGKEGIWVIPVSFHRKWVEFVPRDKGGGYVDEYEPNHSIVKNSVKAEKGTNKIIKSTGNILTETGYFPCLQVKDDGTVDQIVITVSSSAWNFSKDWLALMRSKKVYDENGKLYPKPPAFWSHMYRIGSHTVKNKEFNWKQFYVIEDKKLEDVALYNEAREFNRVTNALKFGAVNEDVDTNDNTEDEETEY